MNTTHILIAALLAGAFAPAVARASAPLQFHLAADADANDADDAGGPPDSAREIRRERLIVNGHEVPHLPLLDHDRLGAGLHMRAQAVKNAPYSAEIISEQQQNLSDGNQIVNKSSSMSYRDSAGRTRQEMRDAGGTLRTVTINDPTDGTVYILHPDAKTATKIGPRGEIARLARDKARDEVRREMRKEGGEQIIVKRIERQADGEARQRIREEVRIRVHKDLAERPSLAGMERIGPAIAGAFGDIKWASKATVKDLGTKEIDGVKAQGKLRSYEIPAGEIGNRNPIIVASESWYSPDLQVTVMTKRSDPRTGERTWRMAGIKRVEPAAALFAVPSDYAIKDIMTHMKKAQSIDKK